MPKKSLRNQIQKKLDQLQAKISKLKKKNYREQYNYLLVKFLKNSELLRELAHRIKDKRIRLTQRLEGQCIGGLLSWDDKYWLDLSHLDQELGQYWKTHWHTLETEPEEEKIIFNCQECQSPIKMSQPKKGGLKVLEFYGKWTGQGHKLVCQKCLENNQL